MENNNMINSLLEKKFNEILKSELYQRYIKFIDILNVSLIDYKKILELDVSLYSEFLDDISIQKIEFIKYLILNNIIFDESEIIKNIQQIKDKQKNSNMQKVVLEYEELQLIKEIIDNDSISLNIEKIILFIEKCYRDGLISIDEAIKLNIYLSCSSLKKRTEGINEIGIDDGNIESKDIIIVKNKADANFRNLFLKYNYDYDSIEAFAKNKLEAYGKEENVLYVLDFIDRHCDESDKSYIIPLNSKLVIDLIVFFDKKGIDMISNILNFNNVKLLEIIKYSSIFFRENLNYIFKDNLGNDIKNAAICPSGLLESLTFYISGYKNSNNLPQDYKISSKEIKNILNYFKVPFSATNHNYRLVSKYHLLSDKLGNKDESFLNGKHTEYILDRCVEFGLEDYVKKYPSFLNGTNSPFKFYKIKRAIDLGQSIYSKAGGLRKELSSDDASFNGIELGENNDIIQQEMSMGDLVKGIRSFPDYYNYQFTDDPEESAQKVYDLFYNYDIFTPSEIFKKQVDYKSYVEVSNELEEIFKNDYKADISYESVEHEIVDLLDNYYIDDEIPLKKDDNTYAFFNRGNGRWRDLTVLISRHKVIRICGMIKNLNIDLNEPISENILLSILVKDSILCMNELNCLRYTVRMILSKYRRRNDRGVK